MLKYCGDEFGIKTRLDTELSLLTTVLGQGTVYYMDLDWNQMLAETV